MSDPVRELNNFLQEVQRPTNLTPLLSFRNERTGPDNQVTHNGTYTFRNTVVGSGRGTSVGQAKHAAATQALQYFRTQGIPE